MQQAVLKRSKTSTLNLGLFAIDVAVQSIISGRPRAVANRYKFECKNCHSRKSLRSWTVMVGLRAVESEPSIAAPNKGKPGRKVGHLKMRVMEDLTAESINAEVKKCVEPTSTILTDGYLGYNKLKEVVAKHNTMLL